MANEHESGVESEDFYELSVDSPLNDPKADRLGYAPFAKHLADSICKMRFAEGYVIAVYGSWNSGKSTLLNFIVHYLKQKPKGEQPIIVPFNPWLFSGEEDITRRFFDQLQSVLNEQKFVPRGWKDRIADFAKVVSQIPLPYAQAGNAVAEVFDDKQKDAADLKAEVEDTLVQEHPRIVVTIDDIDRLDTEEIKKLFRIIKAFPYFTDVVYILFFDQKLVAKALAETQETSGQTYLDKVVQLAFELPAPNKTLVRRLLFEKLNALLADTPKQLFNQKHWGDIYYQGIDHFINKPRDIVRLLDNLSATYPAVVGEVNPVDFIAIETLRVFCPIVYNVIRKNSQVFAGQAGVLTSVDIKRFHNSWLAQLQDQDKEPVKHILIRLFPKSAVADEHTHDVETAWRKQLRVCSLEVFPIYFRLVLPEVELSNTEMRAILAKAGDAKVFGQNLLELSNQKLPDGTTQVRTFLERLEDYTETEISLDCIPSITQSFFDVGDRLLCPEDEPWGIFDFGNDVRIERIIWQLLLRLDEPVRFEILKESMLKGNALLTIVREVANLGQQQGKYGIEPSPEEEWLLSSSNLQGLEKIALQRVQDAAQQNTLLQTPGLPQILYYWQEWTSKEEVKQWVEKVSGEQEGLVDFLEKFLEKTTTQSVSDMVPIASYAIDLEAIELYIEPSSVIERVRSYAPKHELTEEQSTAIKQFIQEFDTRQQGKNSDEPNASKSED